MLHFFDRQRPKIKTGAMAIASLGCPKCVVLKKSGKSSCCGRGGSWFNRCGSDGSAHHDHTWTEGIQACRHWVESKRPAGSSHTLVSASTTAYDIDSAYGVDSASLIGIAAAPGRITVTLVNMLVPTPIAVSSTVLSNKSANARNTVSDAMTMSKNSIEMVTDTPKHAGYNVSNTAQIRGKLITSLFASAFCLSL